MKQSPFFKMLMVALSVLFLCGNFSQAEHHEKKEEKSKEFSHTFSLGLEKALYFYKEPNVDQDDISRRFGALWVKWRGNLWGVLASYRLTWQDKLFLQPELRILYGKHQYIFGRKERIISKTQHKISTLLYEPRLIVGGHVPVVNSKIIISPYTGIGYRFKSDDSEEVKTSRGNNLGFYRKSNYVYVPLGASADYVLNDTWSVSFKGEYDWIIKAWHYSRRPETPANVYKQPNGYGLKGEASISYLYKKVKFSVSPYINYWNVRNSKEKNRGTMEPYNITWESGIKLGITF